MVYVPTTQQADTFMVSLLLVAEEAENATEISAYRVATEELALLAVIGREYVLKA